jgi:hypothetical protein
LEGVDRQLQGRRDKDMLSQVSKLKRQGIEGEIKRNDTQQKVALLKRKILVIHDADQGDAAGDTANKSGSGSDVEDTGCSDDAEAEPHRR